MSVKCTLSIIVLFFCSVLFAQVKKYTLRDCIDYALTKTESQIKEMEYDISMEKYHVSRASFLPSLSINSQQNISIGRVLDPTTYQFVTNRTVFDMSTSIGGSIILFSGLEKNYQVKKDRLNVLSAEMDWEKTKNDLKLEVTRLFLRIMMDKEAIDICENKIILLERQEDMIVKKVEYQTATQSDVLNIQADITRAEIERSSAVNDLNIDKVAMCELLEIDDWESFDVVFDNEQAEPRMWSLSDVIANASGLPQIHKKEVAVELAKREVQIALASFWPTIKLNAGYGSTYSNARVKATGEDYVFYDQLRDNMSSYVSVSLSIPILSAVTVSHTVKARKYAVQASELELQRSLLALDKDVKQAIVQVNTAYDKYRLLAKEVEKDTEALRQTETKYNAGLATYFDYQIALGNLFQAEAHRLQSRYEYIYRTKIMDFYMGNPLYGEADGRITTTEN